MHTMGGAGARGGQEGASRAGRPFSDFPPHNSRNNQHAANLEAHSHPGGGKFLPVPSAGFTCTVPTAPSRLCMTLLSR